MLIFIITKERYKPHLNKQTEVLYGHGRRNFGDGEGRGDGGEEADINGT